MTYSVRTDVGTVRVRDVIRYVLVAWDRVATLRLSRRMRRPKRIARPGRFPVWANGLRTVAGAMDDWRMVSGHG